MKKAVMTIAVAVMTMVTTSFGEIIKSRYADEFGDPTGNKYIAVAGYGKDSTLSHSGAFFIHEDGSCKYRYMGYLTTVTGRKNIKLRNKKGETLDLYVNTVDLGNNKQSYNFRDKSQEVIEFLKKSVWVKVVVWDYTSDAKLVKIDLNGVTRAINSYFPKLQSNSKL